MTLQELLDFGMRYGHYPILVLLIWILIGLHKNGVKMTFDFHVFSNGKDKEKEEKEL